MQARIRQQRAEQQWSNILGPQDIDRYHPAHRCPTRGRNKARESKKRKQRGNVMGEKKINDRAHLTPRFKSDLQLLVPSREIKFRSRSSRSPSSSLVFKTRTRCRGANGDSELNFERESACADHIE